MGANCQGYCAPQNQYEFEIATSIAKKDFRRLTHQDLHSQKLELGPNQPLEAAKRLKLLREEIVDTERFESKVREVTLVQAVVKRRLA